ncbi:MAG TPA: ribosome maturation factor RimP [Thermoanaerobaculia bacterium]|nr:ribosome maturation factor RimP [Thermoanaerobaculia bacterium]
MKTALGEKTTREIGAIAEERGCRLLAIESAGAGRFTVLRVVLEHQDGSAVTVEDCEAVSRDVSAVLDAADEISHRYTLEVSSAGLDRKLYSLDDARRFVGRRVRIKTDEAVVPKALERPGAKPPAISPARNFGGVLESVDGDVLTVVDEAERRIYNVRFGVIRLARLDYQWPERGREGR